MTMPDRRRQKVMGNIYIETYPIESEDRRGPFTTAKTLLIYCRSKTLQLYRSSNLTVRGS